MKEEKERRDEQVELHEEVKSRGYAWSPHKYHIIMTIASASFSVVHDDDHSRSSYIFEKIINSRNSMGHTARASITSR